MVGWFRVWGLGGWFTHIGLRIRVWGGVQEPWSVFWGCWNVGYSLSPFISPRTARIPIAQAPRLGLCTCWFLIGFFQLSWTQDIKQVSCGQCTGMPSGILAQKRHLVSTIGSRCLIYDSYRVPQTDLNKIACY